MCSLGTWADGIEIFNGHYGTATALANGRWALYDQVYDELLTAGHRLWCFANDDFHDPEDFDNAFNMLLVAEATPTAIVDAAKNGRSYASTGLRLVDVAVAGNAVSVTVDNECDGSFVGPGGERLSTTTGRTFTYEANDQAYIRFQAEGENGRIFLQPMFRRDG